MISAMSGVLKDRDPGRCSSCGERLVAREPTHGVPYWACPTLHDPPVVVQDPRELAYATALVNARITAPLQDHGDDLPVDNFDVDRADPGRFVDALCDRLLTKTESKRDRERERHFDSGTSAVDGTEQGTLGRWS